MLGLLVKHHVPPPLIELADPPYTNGLLHVPGGSGGSESQRHVPISEALDIPSTIVTALIEIPPSAPTRVLMLDFITPASVLWGIRPFLRTPVFIMPEALANACLDKVPKLSVRGNVQAYLSALVPERLRSQLRHALLNGR